MEKIIEKTKQRRINARASSEMVEASGEDQKADWHNGYMEACDIILEDLVCLQENTKRDNEKCNLASINKQRELLIAFKDDWNMNNDIRSEEITVADVDNYLCSLPAVTVRYLLEVTTDKGNYLEQRIVNKKEDADKWIEFLNEEYEGYKITCLEINAR